MEAVYAVFVVTVFGGLVVVALVAIMSKQTVKVRKGDDGFQFETKHTKD